jgi:hypothetical protein
MGVEWPIDTSLVNAQNAMKMHSPKYYESKCNQQPSKADCAANRGFYVCRVPVQYYGTGHCRWLKDIELLLSPTTSDLLAFSSRVLNASLHCSNVGVVARMLLQPMVAIRDQGYNRKTWGILVCAFQSAPMQVPAR